MGGIGKWSVAVIGAGLLSLAGSTSDAAVLNCLSGCNQTFAGALWITTDQQPTGSGVIDSFVRIQGNDDVIDGHNSSGRKLLNDENSSPTFTRDLQLGAVPIKTINGQAYYEFLLDINQEGSDAGLSLDKVQICLDASGGLLAADTCPSGPPEYNLDAVGDNEVVLNYNLNHGSGSGDLLMYIPVSTLGASGEQYVYLYSQFGANTNGYTAAGFDGFEENAGYEEWAVGQRTAGGPPPTVIPEPASLLLFGSGLAAAARAVRRRSREVVLGFFLRRVQSDAPDVFSWRLCKPCSSVQSFPRWAQPFPLWQITKVAPRYPPNRGSDASTLSRHAARFVDLFTRENCFCHTQLLGFVSPPGPVVTGNAFAIADPH